MSKKHALTGGVISAVLFELAKYGFGIYVKEMPSYENIYGAVAVIPLFLIWIYVSWVIVLFGAHITFCLSSFRLQDEIEHRSKGSWTYLDALRVLDVMYQAQKNGETISVSKLIKNNILLPHHQMNELLEHLKRLKWVNQNSSDQWLLSKDMKETSLYDLHTVLPVRLPITTNELEQDKFSSKLKACLANHHQEVAQHLSISIHDFLKEESA